jgi:large subunit ribosomal protein L4
MNLEVFNIEGKGTGRTIALPEAVFGITPNEHAVYLAVKQYSANQRQGTHKSKERNEVKGSTRKLHKQKGTGGSRKGDIKNPLFRGGGRIFGPRPRNYEISLNKKVKLLAKLSVLSDKAINNNIIVVEDINFTKPRTKEFVQVLSNLGVGTARSLYVTGDYDTNAYLSSRNLQKAQVSAAKDLNTYAVMNASKLVLSESAVQRLIEEFN